MHNGLRNVFLIVVIVFSVCLSALASVPFFAAAQGGSAALIDLPAAVLTPGDGASAGIEELGRFENGHYRTLSEYSAIRSGFLNIPLTEVETEITTAGYLQGYTSNLGIPQQPGDPQSPPSRVVFSSIYQYATAEGAESAFAFNTRYDGVTIATVDTSLSPSAPIGDQAVMTRTTSATMEEEGPSDQVDTLFRVGNIIAATGIIDYGMTAESVASPAPADPTLVAQVEQLASRLIERITAAQNGTVPDLSGMSLTLVSEDADPGFTSAGYRRLDGEDVPYYNGYQDDLPELLTDGMIAVYEVTQGLGDPGIDPFDPFFATRLFEFSTEDAAIAFLAGVLDAPGDGREVVPGGAEQLEGDAGLVQYEFEVAPGVMALGYQVFQRSGTLVAMLLMESADHRPDQQVVLDLARVQATCLAGGCESQSMPGIW
ncbi:hypothetical protein BH24CHL4_BH24CHL4_19780 [soil metagenome]